MEPITKKLTSRKFILTVIVLVTVALNASGVTGLESEELFTLVATVAAFIFGESALDRERIKATQLTNLQSAQAQLNNVVKEANELLSERDQTIEALRLLIDAADGEDPEGV